MCRTCGKRHNSYQSDPSASGIPQDVSVESAGSLPFSFGISSPGKVSPLRGCNLKEYEEQLNQLKKENFNLKVRIYYLEDFMGKKCNFKDDKGNLHKANLELKVESEALKKELYDKQELIRQASALFSTQESKYKDQLDQVKEQHEREADELKSRVYHLEKEVENYAERCLQEGKDLTQLCGLAFSSDGSEDDFGNNGIFAGQELQNSKPLHLPGMSRSPLQGIFSFPEAEPSLPAEQKSGFRSLESVIPQNSSSRIVELEHQVKHLEKKVSSLEEELKDKERISEALEEDVNNLKRELDDREDKLADLEVEVAEKDQKVDQLMQDLETRHREIEAKDSTIQTLHDDLNKVEPEIEIKVQEIIERDRIIEEKIEQLQQQNKILVEIQITLDEKQKQIAELEAKILETQQKNEKLSSDVELSCETIKNLACEIMNRDKEIGTLKKELKRKEKKCRDLVAELNEYSDMLKKANWEKETSGGEDGVKEMVEEENERLWAELEQKKLDLVALENLKETALRAADETIRKLQEKMESDEARIKELESHPYVGSEGGNSKILEVQKDNSNEMELVELREKLVSRDSLLKSHQAMTDNLKSELFKVREEMAGKNEEMREMKKELFKKNSDVQDFITNELFGRSKELRDLQGKLCSLNFGENDKLEALKLFMESRKEIPNDIASQAQARSNSLSKLSEEIVNASEKPENSNQSGAKSGRSNSLSQLENALFAQMGQKVYNTNQTFNTYVIAGESDAKSSLENIPTGNLIPAVGSESQIELISKELANDCQVKALLSNVSNKDRATSKNDGNASQHMNPKGLQSAENKLDNLPLSPIVNDRLAIQMFGQEMKKLNLELQTMKNEREILREQLYSLQHMNQKENDIKVSCLNENEVSTLKKQLEEFEEQTHIKDQAHDEIVINFQDQIEILKGELKEANRKKAVQVLQIASYSYNESLKAYKQEIISLRKRLVDSHNACDLLRNRLEELVDFFEQILEMDKNGLVNLSQLSAHQRHSLQKTLDDSRALSHSLSHSLMIGTTDSTFGDNDMQNNCDSIFNLPLSELPDEIDLARIDLSMTKNSTDHYEYEGAFDISAFGENHPEVCQSLTAKINSHVDSKTQEFEAIELKLDHLARVIQEKDDQMEAKNRFIQNLKSGIEKLQNELKMKDQILLQSELDTIPQSFNDASQEFSLQNDTNLSLHMSALQHSVASPKLEYSKGIFSQPSSNHENCSSSETLPPPSPFYSSQEDCKSVKSNEEVYGQKRNKNIEQDNATHSYSCNDDPKVSFNSCVESKSQIECRTPQRVHLDLEAGEPQDHTLIAPSFLLASPSESEAWSEPDRNVSLARIGLDACTLFTVSHDRSLSRSRLTRSAPFTSESEGEGHSEDIREGSVGQVTPAAKLKRRTDAAEVKRLSSKLKSMEQLNETLRAELHIYQTLNEQLDKRASNTKTKKAIIKPQMSDKSVLADVSMEDETSIIIPSPLLQEIRSLRLKLEEAITNNDLLRDQLEAALAGYINEETRSLTQNLAAAQQELKLKQDIIIAASSTEQQLRLKCTENESKTFEFSERLAEYMTLSQQHEKKIVHLLDELKETRDQLTKSEGELLMLQSLKQGSESLLGSKIGPLEKEIIDLSLHTTKLQGTLKDMEQKVMDKDIYIESLEKEKSECEVHMTKLEAENKELALRVIKIEQSVSPAQFEQVHQNLQESLQNSEKKFIEVTNLLHNCENKLRLITKERFVLLGEKSQLESKLATAKTEAELLKSDIKGFRELSMSPSEMYQKMEKLNAEKVTLMAEKHAVLKDRQLLSEEIAVLKSHLQMKERQIKLQKDNKELVSLTAAYDHVRNQYMELQDRYSCLQDKMSTLHKDLGDQKDENMEMQKNCKILNDKLVMLQGSFDTLQSERHSKIEELKKEKSSTEKETEKMITQLREYEMSRKELSLQLDAERCLTSNLQMQIHKLQSRTKDTYDNASENQDLPSPSSATSVELSRPIGNFHSRGTDNFISDIYTTKENHYQRKNKDTLDLYTQYTQSWCENKENHFPLNKKNLSLPQFNHSLTSGESPDLGIGSDGQFSSMEKIYVGQKSSGFLRNEYVVADDRKELLCSIPSHSHMFTKIEHLRQERDELSEKLLETKGTLKETLEQLAKSNSCRESVERAMCRQLTKTHDVLKKANGNLRQTKVQQMKRCQSDQPAKTS